MGDKNFKSINQHYDQNVDEDIDEVRSTVCSEFSRIGESEIGGQISGHGKKIIRVME